MDINSLAANFLKNQIASGNSKITQEDIQNAYKNISDDFAKAGRAHDAIWDINADNNQTIDEDEFLHIMNTALSDVHNKVSSNEDYKIFFGIFNTDNDNGINKDEYNEIISNNREKDGNAITTYSLWTTFLHGEEEDESLKKALSGSEDDSIDASDNAETSTTYENTKFKELTNREIENIVEKIQKGEATLSDYTNNISHDDFMKISESIDNIKNENTNVNSTKNISDTNRTAYVKSKVGGMYAQTTNTIDSNLRNRIDSKLGNGFSAKVENIARKLNCNPNDLLAIMYSESGINAHQGKASGGAVGLIQFLPSVCKNYGYTPQDVLNMSHIEQLDFVEKVFSDAKSWNFDKNERLDAGTLYSLCFLPAVADSEVLCDNNEKLAWAYNANSPLDIDKNGDISKTDLAQRVANKYNEMYKWL